MIMATNNTKHSPLSAKAKTVTVNVWLNTHNSLSDAEKIEARNAVMVGCGWSQNTFYNKMRTPEKVRDIEKPVIAKAYRRLTTTLFPELKKQRA